MCWGRKYASVPFSHYTIDEFTAGLEYWTGWLDACDAWAMYLNDLDMIISLVLAGLSALIGVDGFANYAPGWARFAVGVTGAILASIAIYSKMKQKDLKDKAKERYDLICQEYRKAIESSDEYSPPNHSPQNLSEAREEKEDPAVYHE